MKGGASVPDLHCCRRRLLLLLPSKLDLDLCSALFRPPPSQPLLPTASAEKGLFFAASTDSHLVTDSLASFAVVVAG
jgi:hypothetical protein